MFNTKTWIFVHAQNQKSYDNLFISSFFINFKHAQRTTQLKLILEFVLFYTIGILYDFS